MPSDPISARIAVALDVNDFEQARSLVSQLASYVGWFKFGTDLDECVPIKAVAAMIHDHGCRAFLDDKFIDVPSRMERKARWAVRLGADMFTVHALALEKGVRAAVENRGAAKVIAVTLFTSIKADDIADGPFDTRDYDGLNEIDGGTDLVVRNLAKIALDAGADGLVSSAVDIAALAYELAPRSPGFLVTAGIRPVWAPTNDQDRVMTPEEAVAEDADLLVIGRPITQPPVGLTPVEAVKRIRGEIESALQGRVS